jgi:hypothetical protein
MQIVVRFDREVAVPADCGTVISMRMVETLGKGFTCDWEAGRVLRIRLGANTSFGLGNQHVLELVGGLERPRIRSSVQAIYRKTPEASYELVYNPKDIIEVAAQLRGPTVVETCTEVSLDAIVTGTGGRPPIVNWTCTGCAALEGYEPYLMEAQNTFSLRLPAQVVQVTTETVFTFEVKVTNFLQSTSSATFDLTVRNTGLPLPIVTLGTPAEQIFFEPRRELRD